MIRGLALGLALTTGCSFATIDRPIRKPGVVRCDTTSLPIIIDLGLGGASALYGAAIFATHPDGRDNEAVFALGLIAVPFVLSAVYGLRRTAECRDLQAAYPSGWIPAPAPQPQQQPAR